MLISKKWIKEYFAPTPKVGGPTESVGQDLPSAKEMADALTMHSFEVENVENKGTDEVLDVKVLPNRAHDCLCHRGIAREVATLLNKKFADRELPRAPLGTEEKEAKLEVKIDEAKLCPRYMGKRIENIEIKPSPNWLSEKLETLGERSINNIVDITNYVMLDLGQPMHAFDADKVEGNIQVRLAKPNEKITLLTGEEVILPEKTLVISDGVSPLAIAGIKGGKKAEVTESTKNIILESANFNSAGVRKSAQKVGIKNNASKRYENGISPELAEPAMNYAVKLISKEASTEKTKFYKTADAYPHKRNPYKVGISVSELVRLLGTEIKEKEVEDILDRTGWEWEKISPRGKIIELAQKNISKPYKYGASISYDAPNYFDCSSFTAYLYAQSGLAIPRITADQFVFGKEINRSDLEPGDVIFSQNGNDAEEKEVTIIATGETIQQKVLHTKTFEFLPGTPVPEGIDHNGVYLGDGKIIYASGMWHKNQVVIEDLESSPSFKNIKGYRKMANLDEERYVVTAPFERLDLRIKEDLVEEIGRIYGYEKIKPAALPNTGGEGRVNPNLEMAQKARLALASLGYSEIYNYAFRKNGEVETENPIASDKPFLRNNLSDGIRESLEMNFKNAPLLCLAEIKIFEIGTVFKSANSEQINVAWGTKNKKEVKVEEYSLEEAVTTSPLTPLLEKKRGTGENIFNLPQNRDAKFRPISPYPFVLRDIAVWVPAGTDELEVLKIILENSGELLVKKKLFDRFEKPGKDGESSKISYAFNLVFQSHSKTLTDTEINEIMNKITAALNAQNGWQVR